MQRSGSERNALAMLCQRLLTSRAVSALPAAGMLALAATLALAQAVSPPPTTSVGQLNTVTAANNATYYPTFVAIDQANNQTVWTATAFTYNPGTGILTATVSSPGAGTIWSAVAIATAAVAGRGYIVDTTAGTITVTLPAAPAVGDYIRFVDAAGTFATNNLTVARNGLNIMGAAANLTVSTNNSSFGLVYQGATNGWRLVGA
jgi:hypothetical protein